MSGRACFARARASAYPECSELWDVGSLAPPRTDGRTPGVEEGRRSEAMESGDREGRRGAGGDSDAGRRLVPATEEGDAEDDGGRRREKLPFADDDACFRSSPIPSRDAGACGGVVCGSQRGRTTPSPPSHRLSLVVFLLLVWATPSLGGICWTSMARSGHCVDLMSQRMGREDCCSADGASTSWSHEDMDAGALFFWRVLGGGVPCQPCKETCTGVTCGEGKRCVMRKGRPKCACAPDCRRGKGSKRSQRGPVCGSDGRSYRSACRLRKRSCRKKSSNLSIAYYGYCQKAATCRSVHCREGQSCLTEPMSGHPRCVTCSQRCPRGHRRTTLPPTTGNSSGVSQENSSVATPKKPNAHGRGWSSWGPLCGSNERTYESWCHMLKDACATGFVISTKHLGVCDEEGTQL